MRDQLEEVRLTTGGGVGGVDRSPLAGVLLTHAHIGHYLGLAFFGFEAVHTRHLPVFATRRMCDFLTRNHPWRELLRRGNIALYFSPPGAAFSLADGLAVTPIRAPHRDELSDTVGYLFQGPRASLLYVPDTDSWEGWQPPITELARGVDYALLDGTFYSAAELPGRDVTKIGHPLITRTMDLLAPLVAGGKPRVFFTHLNHSNPALDSASPERREIERRGFKVLDEAQEFPLVDRSLIAETAVQDRRQALDAVDQPRAGPAEAAVGIDRGHLAEAHGAQRAPLVARRHLLDLGRARRLRRSRRAWRRSSPGRRRRSPASSTAGRSRPAAPGRPRRRPPRASPAPSGRRRRAAPATRAPRPGAAAGPRLRRAPPRARASSPAMSSSAARSLPTRDPTRRMSAKTSARPRGSSDTTSGQRGRGASAPSTCSVETAHTGQSS